MTHPTTMVVAIAFLMSLYEAERGRLAPLVERLPFKVDDFDAVNQSYVTWRESGSDEAKDHVLIWGYCYVYDYFLTRFVGERISQASDFDYLVTRVYTRVQKKLDSVQDPARFAAWVSVACCNALKNFRRDRKNPAEEVEETLKVLNPEDTTVYDQRFAQRALDNAIQTLPPALQEVAEMKLFKQLDYKDIEKKTGRSVPTIRALVSKALIRLREDSELRALYLGSDLDA